MKLKKELSLLEVTFYGVGVIVGAGIFSLIGKAAGLAGNSLWISFLISALISIFTGFSYAELAAMYPKSGAEFVYVKKAYGSEFWAFLIGWLLIFALTAGIATVALAFSGYFLEVFSFFNFLPNSFIAVLLIVALSFLNFQGIKESSKFNILFVVLVIASLLFIIILGLPKIFSSVSRYFEAPKGIEGVLSATTLVFFAYLGFEDIANLAEETKNPKKIIPLALILSILITTLIYSLVSLSAVSLVGWEELSKSQAPLALAASKILGEKAFLFVSFSAIFATIGTCLGLLIANSRMIYGIAKENCLPKFLAKIHYKNKTPHFAILTTMILSIIFALSGSITRIAQITSFYSLIAFCAVNLSLIYLRFMKPELKRPFLAPLNVKNFPLTAFFGTISCMALMGFFSLEVVIFCFFISICGIIFFYFFKREKLKKLKPFL
ncbi:MAG: amino acid permease [Candidatus Aenigmatarchaeota archaeon]